MLRFIVVYLVACWTSTYT